MGYCSVTSAPQNKYIQKMTNYRHLNRMRVYDKIALFIAGPFDFSRVLQGD
jgi:hypothetical protein